MKWARPAVQAVISVLLLYMLISCGLLPAKYLGIIVAVVVLLLAITFLFSRSKNLAARSIGTIVAVIFCVVLVFATVYIRQVVKTLDQISTSNTEINNMVVAVAQTNGAQTIEETSGYTFGVYEGTDASTVQEMVKEVGMANGDAQIQTRSFSSALEMAQALLDGTIDAAICNQAYTSLLDDAIQDYSSQIRVIFEKAFEVDPGAADPAVDSDGSDDTHTTIDRGEGKDTVIARDISLTEDSYTILISGIDVSGPINTTSRSDVNILMTVNPKTHKILLTTTPRDYFVLIPGVSGDQRDKLTHAGIYGIRTSMRTLQNLYGIDITNYIRINFDSLVQLVDALDGVDVDSEFEFDSMGFHFVQGTNHLNGEQALAFSRGRYAFETGDNQRGKNQMLVLTAIINKLQSPALLKNPSNVLDVVGRSMQTSIPSSDIRKVISWQLDNPRGWSISRQAVTGTDDNQQTFSMPGTSLYVMWPDEASVTNAAKAIEDMMR